MEYTILDSVGKNGRNLPDDVTKIQQLLAEIGMAPYSWPDDVFDIPQSWNVGAGVQACVAAPAIDPATVRAIEDFQRLWGLVDGRVDAAGSTLRRLNGTKTPLQLSEIQLAYLYNSGPHPCGYWIRYTGRIPPSGYNVFLSFSAAPVTLKAGNWVDPAALSGFLDITSRSPNCVICRDNLPLLLELMAKAKLWAPTRANVTLFVTKGCRVISRSNSVLVNCPVKPYSGNLMLSLGSSDLGEAPDTAPILYNGAADGSGGGAMFHIPAIDGKYYFEYHGKFETDNARRGFDCTTFAGAVFEVDPNTGAMGGTAETLADHLGAQLCGMEGKSGKEVKTFFSTHKTGRYILGSGGHVMLVVDGVIHEFNIPVGQPGYKHDEVGKYTLQGTFFVRRL
jgi:hypothetical protein